MFSTSHIGVWVEDCSINVEEVEGARQLKAKLATVSIDVGSHRLCMYNASPTQLEAMAQRLLVIAHDVRTKDYSGDVHAAVVDAIPAD